jgi:riboflavin biosynthesis pyrimidine reductase
MSASMSIDRIDRRLEALYGVVDWRAEAGVVQVAAIEHRRRAVLVPGPKAPASETDRFVLAVARARADAIVTTGAILRAEPDVRHDPAPDAEGNSAFLDWRRERLGRSQAPLLVVLSASGQFPVDHVAVSEAIGGFVWTTPQGAARLREVAGERIGRLDVFVGVSNGEGIVGAISRIDEMGTASTVLVEAGPSASAPLYAAQASDESVSRRESGNPPRIRCDELLLNRFEGAANPEALGPVFPSARSIEQTFEKLPHLSNVEDASGRWTILRYRADQRGRRSIGQSFGPSGI